MPLDGVLSIPRRESSGLIAGSMPREASVHTDTASFIFLRCSGALASARRFFALARRSALVFGVIASSLKLTRPGDRWLPLSESGLESYPPDASSALGLRFPKFAPGEDKPPPNAFVRGFVGEIFF